MKQSEHVKSAQEVARQHQKDLMMQLYALPDNLNVDQSKTDANVRYADRTAEHIRKGLQEVALKPTEKDTESAAQKELKRRLTKAERKQVFSQLMSVQGSSAKRQ